MSVFNLGLNIIDLFYPLRAKTIFDRAARDNLAVFHPEQLIGIARGEINIMQDNQGAIARIDITADQIKDTKLMLGVERGDRFIRDEVIRLGRQSAGEMKAR